MTDCIVYNISVMYMTIDELLRKTRIIFTCRWL